MARVRVRYLGLIRTTVGKKEEYVDLSQEATLGNLLNLLGRRYGKSFENSLQDDVKIVIDGQGIRDTNFLLKGEHDIEIALIPMSGCCSRVIILKVGNTFLAWGV